MERETFPILDTYERIACTRVKTTTSSFNVLCPIHNESTPSCTIDTDKNIFYSHCCGIGGDAVVMVLHARVIPDGGNRTARYKAAFDWLRSAHDRPFQEKRVFEPAAYQQQEPLLDAVRKVFTFHGDDGSPLYDEVRIDGYDPDVYRTALEHGLDERAARKESKAKRIKQRRRLPAGRWLQTATGYSYFDMNGVAVVWGPEDPEPIEYPFSRRDGSKLDCPTSPYLSGKGALRGLPRVLFRQPKVRLAAREGKAIVFPEGPNKAEAIVTRTGLCGTTLASGANGEFTLDHALTMIGASCVLFLEDSDPIGRQTAMARARIAAEVVGDVRVVDFFGDDSGRDVMQWLEACGRANRDEIRTRLERIASNSMRIGPSGTILPSTPFTLT